MTRSILGDDPVGEIPVLDSYPAGPNHEDLLLCGPENDTQWIMSNEHVDLQEIL